MRGRRWTVGLALLLAVLLASCVGQQYILVQDGEYGVVDTRGTTGEAAGAEIESMSVDRENSQVVFTLTDGSQVPASFTVWPRGQWPSGCPANVGSTVMEVLALSPDPLVLGDIALPGPILVRNCPPTPEQLVLRDAGPMGGEGNACTGASACVFFEPSMTLPQSMKGYELYSWMAGDRWHFALLTGTDRSKSPQEVTSGERVVDDDGWVHMTVSAVGGLKSLLAELPAGAQVLWMEETTGGQSTGGEGPLKLPDRQTTADVEAFCRSVGVSLAIVRAAR